MSFSMVNPGGFWFQEQIKMLWRIKPWMYLRHLTSGLRKITKHNSHLQSSVFGLNQTKITHSTGNELFNGQPRWIVIWSTSKNVMKDKSLNAGLNVPATLDIAPQKNHKTQSHLQSSVFCLNQRNITHSTRNEFFYGQSRWIMIWSTNKNIMKDKSVNIYATLDIAPQKNPSPEKTTTSVVTMVRPWLPH